LITILSACSSAHETTTPTTSAPTLRGTIDGKPFVARSALMTEVNATAHAWNDPGKNVTASTIYVFEREASCSELAHVKKEERYYLKLAEQEHAIQIDMVGGWPHALGTLATATGKDVEVAVQTGESRTDAQGTVTIVEAKRATGVISLDVQNESSKASNNAHGDVRFTVCW
jgi:hypothetical protein